MVEQRMFGLWESPVTARSLSISLRHGWRTTETIERFYGDVERFLTQYVLYA